MLALPVIAPVLGIGCPALTLVAFIASIAPALPADLELAAFLRFAAVFARQDHAVWIRQI